MPMLVTLKINWSRIWDSNLAETKIRFKYLTETHINHDQTHHIRNNWLGPIFFSPVTQKDCLSSFIRVFKVLLRLILIQNRGLCPLRLLLLMAEFLEFSVFMTLQNITPESSYLQGISLKDYKIIWKIKVREIKAKQCLRTLN